jgi:hypothetical protein
MKRMDRRRFTKELAFLSGVTVTIGACGGGGYSSPTGGTPPPTTSGSGDKVGQISANHGHTAVITAAQVTGSGPVQINIQGTAGHNHVVALPAAAIVDMQQGRTVETNSTTQDGHMHTVTFNGTTSDPPSRY